MRVRMVSKDDIISPDLSQSKDFLKFIPAQMKKST